MTSRPSRVLAWLLRLATSRDAATAQIGDIVEDCRQRDAVGRPPRWPALWINVQTLRAIASAILAGARRLPRSTGLILRDAGRALRVAPAASLFVILVLAAGVTTATVTFSVVDAVLLRPLPFDEPEQLVSISRRDEARVERITAPLFWRLKDELNVVDSLATVSTAYGGRITVDGVIDEWPVAQASGEIFRVLRWSPAIGRLWTADEEARGETQVAVLSHRFWQEQFGGAATVLDKTVVTEAARSYRVIGVLSAAAEHPDVQLMQAPIWVPGAVPHTATRAYFGLIARMRPGVTPAQVSEAVGRIVGPPDWKPAVTSIAAPYVQPVRHWMLLALGASALVLLIACVNAANLMLTRSARRAHELAIRAALGASRRRVAGVVLAEGMLLSLAATVCALLASVAGVHMARTALTSMPLGIFRAATIALNGRVLVAALAAAAVTGVLVSLVPAWQTSRAPVSSLLKDAESAATAGRRRWRSLFLTAEIASVVVLLVVSWLFVVSFIRVAGIDLGVERTNLLAVKPNIEFKGTVDEVRQRLERVPGVSGVAIATGASLPLIGRAFGGAWATTKLRPADGVASAPPIEALQYRVTANYFEISGLRFLRGGTWPAEVDPSVPLVLDTLAARQLFGVVDPLGRLVHATEPAGVYRVVGTVPHVYARGPEETDPPSAFFPLRLNPTRKFAGLFVRTSRPADEMLSVVTEAVRLVGPDTKEPFVFMADEAVRRITATRRFNAGVMTVFGLVGVLIAAAGVYAVMAAFVAQRTREIGVRLALGATPARIQSGVLSLAWRHLAAGLLFGLPIAWWLAQGFTALLFSVTPADVSVYLGVGALVSVIGLVAAWMPARRAASIDPIISLKR